MVEDTDIGLGYRVRDTISGYEGIVTDIGTHLTGCTRFGVMPDSHEDPTRRGDTEFFYGAQLEILSEDTDYAEDAEDSITEVDFDLGDVVEDDVTGFRGVASTITYNLYNCPRVAVQPQVGSDTILPGGDSENDIDREWFDTPRVVRVNEGVSADYETLINEGTAAETGAPGTDVSRKEDKR